MFLLLLKSFLRSRIAVAGIVIVLLAGITGIFIGQQHIRKQQEAIALTEHFQQEHIQRNAQFFDKELGLLLYYLRFSLVNKLHPLNALSIGQRDVNSSIQSLTIRNLEGQKYDTDLFNPSNLLTGNLDMGFVLIYLLPLLIIAFTYSLLSEEKEDGTWRLVATQSKRPVNVLIRKLFVRMITVLMVFAVLLLLATFILSLPVDKLYLAVICLAFIYMLCWFGISFWVISLQRSSSTNAVILLSIWILLTVVLPGVANNFITSRYPVPESMATVVQQREGYHEKWDMEKQPTVDRFYAHYPQFSKYPLPDKQFSWLWYYAMQQMGDDEAAVQVKQLQEKLRLREQASEYIGYFIPTLHTQQQLNSLAGAGLANQLQFMDSTARFHERMRLYFYPKIFEDEKVKSVDWDMFKVEYFSEEKRVSWGGLLLPLLLVTLVFSVRGWMNFNKRMTAFA